MATYKQLNYGEKSAMVRDFQDALRKVVDPSVGVDGIYGPQTEQFVQKAYSMYPWLSSSAQPRVAILPLVAAVMGDAMNKPNSAIPAKPAEIAAMVPVVAPKPPSKALMLGAAAGVAGLLWLVLKKK